MKKSMSSWLLFGACAMAFWVATAQTEPKKDLVLPGTSVAEVKLGSDPSTFQSAFSQQPGQVNSSQTGTFGEGCPDRIYYWSDLAPNTSVATAYLKNGAISQLSVQGPVFSLPDDLKTGATEEQVRRAYRKGQMYVLLYSGSKVNGGRDLLYWVDKEAGVAFKLAWWQSKKLRLASGIDIFPKGSDYQPEGCVSPPQQWQAQKEGSRRPS
jgi:hypothetical protein